MIIGIVVGVALEWTVTNMGPIDVFISALITVVVVAVAKILGGE